MSKLARSGSVPLGRRLLSLARWWALVEVSIFVLMGASAGVYLFWFVAQGTPNRPVRPRSSVSPAIAVARVKADWATPPCITHTVADAATLSATCISVQ